MQALRDAMPAAPHGDAPRLVDAAGSIEQIVRGPVPAIDTPAPGAHARTNLT